MRGREVALALLTCLCVTMCICICMSRRDTVSGHFTDTVMDTVPLAGSDSHIGGCRCHAQRIRRERDIDPCES